MDNKQPSKAAVFAASVFSYVLPIATAVLFFTGKHTLFLWFGVPMILFEMIVIIVHFIAGETWAVKLNQLLQFLPWILIGCCICHWNIIDGIILGEAFMLLMGAYMKTVDDISLSCLDTDNKELSDPEDED